MGKQLTLQIIKEKLFVTFKQEPVYKAILFGSYAKGVANSKSDIDLVIDSQGELCGLNFFGLLEKIKNSLGKEIDLIEVCEIEKDSAIEKIINKEGIVIYERTKWEEPLQNV